jgi:hypothetical protein
MDQTKPVRRKFFDLKPAELSELQRLDNYISYQRREAIKPARLRASVYGGSTDDYHPSSTVNSGFGHFRPQSLFINQSLT